jgi:tetratricopeptide (TPR) repeat protein
MAMQIISINIPENKILSVLFLALFLMFLVFSRPLGAEESIGSQMSPFDADEVGINLEIGDMAVKAGDYDSAVSAYSRAYLLDNKNFAAVYNLAYTYQLKGALKEALKYYKASSRIDGKRYEPYLNSGAIYMIEKKYELAAAMLKEAVRINPENIDANYNLAVIDIDRADYKSALGRLNKMLESISEKKGSVYYSIKLKSALCHIALGETVEAAKCLDFQSNNNIEEIEKYYLTGCMLHKAGRSDEAAKAFQKSLTLAKTPESESLVEILNEKIAQFKVTKKAVKIAD